MHELMNYLHIIALMLLASILVPLVFSKIKGSFKEYRNGLTGAYLSDERRFNEFVSEEASIYDAHLKFNEKLAEQASLYEIVKEMSKGLKFFDIFKMLSEYLYMTFLFKKARLILIKGEDETSSINMVIETTGLQDSTLKAKGIIPKLEIATRPLCEHDNKISNILRDEIRRIQIVKSKWEQNPYAELLPENCQTFMAIPIVIGDQLMGILAIEDLPASDYEKFSILASQFALEMRRIVLYEKVEEMAITDGLTKAFAKRHMMERLGEEFERSRRHNYDLSFLMIDIDHFKKYNDTYGHLVGDVVLKDIVYILKQNTREVDLVGRFGGEEFCVILPETGRDEAHLVAERIREIVQKYRFKAYDESTEVTISIGIASFPSNAGEIEELIENSDQALYAAKNAGRNRVCVYAG
ncbi:MAG: sensor domain-containing diguanylate cyclase [Candidatus Omnitrophica bacterium]|nr:sensor domain-containing diguanylate cyclase [Candidatus Omnitrophota bacterium]